MDMDMGDAMDDGPSAAADPMRFGLIGADDVLAEQIESIDGLTVARRADPDAGEDWRQVVNPNLVDALVITVAPAWRSSMIQDALAVGVPVMCRGALATDMTEMAMIKRLAGMGGGMVMGWHPWLFHPAYAALREIGDMVGPARAVRAFTHIAAPLNGRDLIWAAAGDAVAGCLDLLGGDLQHAAAERRGEDVLLRLLFPGDLSVQVELAGGRTPLEGWAVHREPVIMQWRSDTGLRLHGPTEDFAPPQDAGERIETPDGGDPTDTAVRTFAHMVMEQEPQPQMLDFAADVVKVLDACARSLD